jgi:hypothetical protein
VLGEKEEDFMEQGNGLLSGIARVLNAGGSALLSIYDAATSLKISALSGEKQKLKGNIRAYEKKIERLYYEIGKEVSNQGDTTRISAAGEAGVSLVTEYREEIERIKQRIEEIETAQRIERQRLLEEREAARKMKREEAEKRVVIPSKKTAPHAEPSWPEAPFASEVSTDTATEEVREIVPEVAVTQAQEIGTDTVVSAEPEASEALLGAATEEEKGAVAEASEAEKEEPHKYTTEELDSIPKAELLALCTEKGIEVDRRMRKAQIIELLLGWHLEWHHSGEL